MAASFPPMMFSMEELVGVVKLIIQMESAVGNDDDKKQQQQQKPPQQNHKNENNPQKEQKEVDDVKHEQKKQKQAIKLPPPPVKNNKNNSHSHYKHRSHNKSYKNGKKKNKEAPNIQGWISRRSKRDILFLLASISGVKMKIYSLPTSSLYKDSQPQPIDNKDKENKMNNNKVNKTRLSKQPIIRNRVCRISMDGKYLSMGEDCINLDKRLEISLGIDLCYSNVRLILKQLGIYNYYTQNLLNGGNGTIDTTSSSSSSQSSSSSSSSIVTDEILRHARFNHRILGSDKLKPKHCITIHNPITNRTLLLQLENCMDRTMWAKGICQLKNSNNKHRNFRWTVVAYLISKYASTLNAHTANKISATKTLKSGMYKGFNVLKSPFTSSSSSSKSKHTTSSHAHHSSSVGGCYFDPVRAVLNAIKQANNSGFDKRYPKKFQKLYKRRQRRLKYHQSNYDMFGENDLIYDPNKVQPKPEDADLYYE